MIRTINRFFSKNSRWLFGIFTVIIIVSFMGFLTPGTFGGCGGSGINESVGTVFGKSVSYKDLRQAMIDIRVFYSVVYNMPVEIPEEMAFVQYASCEAAANRGLSVSDKEISDFLMSQPRFFTDGKFDIAKYKDFIAALEKDGITGKMLQDAIRSNLLVIKLQNSIRESVVVTDGEVEQFWNMYNSPITVRIAEFPFSVYEPKGKIDENELVKFFEINNNKYIAPASTKAWIACFEYNLPEFGREADKAITEAAMKDFYENNKTLFTVNSNGTSVITPYEKAKDRVRIQLRDKLIRDITFRTAQEFAGYVYDEASMKGEKCSVVFENYAAKNNIKVIKVGSFDSNSNKVGAIESKELVKEIFSAAADIPVSNAVAAQKGVYVGLAVDYVKAAPAELKAVRAQVIKDFKADKARQNAIAACDALLKALSAKSPAEAADLILKDKQFKPLAPFVLFSQSQTENNAKDNAIRMMVKDMQVGEFSRMLTIPDGVAIVFMEKRDAADKKAFEAQKVLYTLYYRNFKAECVLEEFNAKLRSQCVLNAQQQ